MQKPILLIAGVMTSGKTTLARLLVKNGIYDFMIELDQMKEWADGMKLRLGKLWNDDPDKARSIVKKGNTIAGLIAAKLPFSTAMSGVWPGEVSFILQSVQDWRLIVLKTPTKDEAWARWLERKLGNEVSGDQSLIDAIKLDFDNSPWGQESWWDEMRVKMVDFALYAEKKGKLFNLSNILSEDQMQLDEFSNFRVEQIPVKS